MSRLKIPPLSRFLKPARPSIIVGALFLVLVLVGSSLTLLAQSGQTDSLSLDKSLDSVDAQLLNEAEPIELRVKKDRGEENKAETIEPRQPVEEKRALQPKDEPKGVEISQDERSVSSSIPRYVNYAANNSSIKISWNSYPFPYLYHMYTSIGDAVEDADAGDIIYLCPGSYPAVGTYSKNITFKPSQDAAICQAGTSRFESFPELEGNTACKYGEYDCTRCVYDVVDTFGKLASSQRNYAFELGDHPDPPFDISQIEFHGHWQGIQRMNYPYSQVLLVSRDEIEYQDHWSGFVVVKDKVHKTWSLSDEFTHPGGIQMMGDILAISLAPNKPETEPPIVHLLDMRDPLNVAYIDSASNPIATYADMNKGSMVAMVQLQDGRYLVIVGRSGTPLDFYISDAPNDLQNFFFIYRWPEKGKDKNNELEFEPNKAAFEETDWDGYQNINLITECYSGDLYLIGTGNRENPQTPCVKWTGLTYLGADNFCMPVGKDWADLYRLDVSGNGVKITKVSEKQFNITRGFYSPDVVDWLADKLYLDDVLESTKWILDEDLGNFDAAAGVHVDRYGRMFLYTTQHGWVSEDPLFSPHYTNVTEFGPRYSTRIQMSQPSVRTYPGVKYVQLVFVDVPIAGAKATKKGVLAGWKYSKEGVYQAGLWTDEYVWTPVKDFGGEVWDFLNPFDRQVDNGTPSIGATQYYTVTFIDDDGNVSPASEIVSATFGMVQLSLPDGYGPAGGYITVPVQTPNAGALSICNADLQLSYDPAVLSPTLVGASTFASGYDWLSQVITPGLLQATISTTVGEELYGSGALLDAGFEVIGTAGDTSWLTLQITDSSLYDCESPDTPLLLDLGHNGTFTVSNTHFAGDVDGNGSVEGADADLALEISVGAVIPTEMQLAAGDLNGDGLINAADAVLIMRLAAGLPRASGRSASQALTVTVSATPTLNLSQGGDGWATVSIDDATDIAGADFLIYYDPFIVSLVDARLTSLTENFTFAFTETLAGEIFLSMKPKAGFEDGLGGGSGPLFELHFEDTDRVQGNAESPLNLFIARLCDRYGRDFARTSLQIDVVMEDGLIVVEDDVPPWVHSTLPVDRHNFVLPDQTIDILFTEAMITESLALQIEPSFVYTPTWIEESNLLLEHVDLEEDVTYTLTVMAEDLAGIPMTQTHTWAFTTTVVDRTPPQVLAVSPVEGSTGVSLHPAFVITFSESIMPNSLYLDLEPDPLGVLDGFFDWTSDWNYPTTVVTVTQNMTLTVDATHTLTVTVWDRFENPLSEPFNLTFSTLAWEVDYRVYLPLIVR